MTHRNLMKRCARRATISEASNLNGSILNSPSLISPSVTDKPSKRPRSPSALANQLPPSKNTPPKRPDSPVFPDQYPPITTHPSTPTPLPPSDDSLPDVPPIPLTPTSPSPTEPIDPLAASSNPVTPKASQLGYHVTKSETPMDKIS